MTKGEKLKAILAERPAASPERAHYLPESGVQAAFQRFPQAYALIKAILSPTFSLHRWRDQVPDPEDAIVLNLGAGTTDLDPELINVDFVRFPHIDVVADFAKPLPFKSGTVDAVLSISVMEHLEDPAAVIREIARILKPEGTLYLATPFQYPFHGAPMDYTRWTRSGLEVLLEREFEVLRVGARGGPMGVVILAMAHAVAQLLCFGKGSVYSVVNFGMMGLMSPIKVMDLVFESLPYSANLCPGFYVTARKKG